MRKLILLLWVLMPLCSFGQTAYRYKRETYNAGKYVTGSTITVTPQWDQMVKTIDSLKLELSNIKNTNNYNLSLEEINLIKTIPITAFYLKGDTSNYNSHVFYREFSKSKPTDPPFMMSVQYKVGDKVIRFYFKDLGQ